MRIRAKNVVYEGAKTTATIVIWITRKPRGYVGRTSCEIVIRRSLVVAVQIYTCLCIAV